MINLYILNEVITNNLNYSFLNILSILAIFSAIFVITSKNPIVSILFLILLFICIACYLMMLGIHFIGLSYLLVYVGAVSILFLFILMLINVRISEIAVNNTNSISLALLIGVILHTSLTHVFTSNFASELTINKIYNTQKYLSTNIMDNILSNFNNVCDNDLSFVTSSIWDGKLAETSHISSIGNVIYTNFPLWIILTSVILLLAMVGSIIITLKK